MLCLDGGGGRGTCTVFSHPTRSWKWTDPEILIQDGLYRVFRPEYQTMDLLCSIIQVVPTDDIP